MQLLGYELFLWESKLELPLNPFTYKLFERRNMKKIAPKTYINTDFCLIFVEFIISAFKSRRIHLF